MAFLNKYNKKIYSISSFVPCLSLLFAVNFILTFQTQVYIINMVGIHVVIINVIITMTSQNVSCECLGHLFQYSISQVTEVATLKYYSKRIYPQQSSSILLWWVQILNILFST